MNALSAGANYDGRSQTVRRGQVKINGVLDENHIHMCKNRIRNKKGAFYDGSGLTGTVSNEQYRAYEGEVVGILANRAGVADLQRFPAGNGTRGAKGQEIRVPVVFNANGIRGNSPAEIDAQVVMLGFAEQTGRQSGKSYLNIVAGGTLTVVNNGPEAIMTGDIILARTPTKDEANRIRARSGDLANTYGASGRIPFILVPYRPEKVDFFQPAARLAALMRYYELKPQGATTKYNNRDVSLPRTMFVRKPKEAISKEVEYHELNFANANDQLVQALAQMLRGALAIQTTFEIPEESMTDADKAKVLDDTAHLSCVDIAIRSILQSGSEQLADRFATDAQVAFAGEGAEIASDFLPLFQKNVFQDFLVAILRFGLVTSSSIMGRAMMSAMPGKDFDIMVGHYMR